MGVATIRSFDRERGVICIEAVGVIFQFALIKDSKTGKLRPRQICKYREGVQVWNDSEAQVPKTVYSKVCALAINALFSEINRKDRIAKRELAKSRQRSLFSLK